MKEGEVLKTYNKKSLMDKISDKELKDYIILIVFPFINYQKDMESNDLPITIDGVPESMIKYLKVDECLIKDIIQTSFKNIFPD